jgi:GntR family transcriptional regulator, transcriptional repressor for pyruvate dehydrogenase complex
MSEIIRLGRARSLADEVAAHIERLVVSRAWPPGERLPAEPDLAERFGVSRSVVRDAIRSLAARGLVDVRHGVGTSVAAPASGAYTDAVLMLLLRSANTIGDLVDARAVIDSGVVVAAARNRTAAHCADLARHVEAMEEALTAGDWQAAFAADLSFHRAVIEATGLPALKAILEPLHHVIASSLLVPDVHNPRLFDAPSHRRIFEAVEAQDEEEARHASAAHFSSRADPAFEALYSTPCSDLTAWAEQVRPADRRRPG